MEGTPDTYDARQLTNTLFGILAVAPHERVSTASGPYYWFSSDRNKEITVGYRGTEPIRRFQEYVLFSNGGPCCSWSAKYDRWCIIGRRDTTLISCLHFVMQSFGYVT